MLFWIIVAVVTAVVAAVLLLPLLGARDEGEAVDRHDAEVYRDQLEELKRDAATGLLSPVEAEQARAEVARRLLGATAAAESAAAPPTRRANRLAQAAVIVMLPAVGLCLYLATGSPDLPDAPLSARLANPGNDMEILVARAERQLAENPQDGAGWDVLAPIYYRSGRIEDAANAYRNALRISGPTPARLGGYAESLIALSGGLVTGEAQDALMQSLTISADDPRARFYLALALEQDGKRAEARTAFAEIARTSPQGAPWLPLVNEHIAKLSPAGDAPANVPGNPTAEDIAGAETMTAGDRKAMIEGMVASLAAKLKEKPDNLEGWLRMVRSYSVLGDRQKATDALRDGLNAFPRDGAGGRQLLALAGELGLDAGEGTK